MRLSSEFIKLPFLFDIERLQQEVNAFLAHEWQPHPNLIPGNYSIPLISADGGLNDNMSGQMLVTEKLRKSPYLQQVIASFNEVFGRSRLMRLDSTYQVPEHCDMHYHWFDRVRIHIPIITNEKVRFHCADKSVHMAAGEAWLFDSWKMHKVINESQLSRVHLVIDTCGSSKFWEMVKNSAHYPFTDPPSIKTKSIIYKEGYQPTIRTEKYNAPRIISPGEINYLVQDLIDDVKLNKTNNSLAQQEFLKRVDAFRKDWLTIWSQYGNELEGIPHFQKIIIKASVPNESVRLSSIDISAQMVFNARVLSVALNNEIIAVERLNTSNQQKSTEPNSTPKDKVMKPPLNTLSSLPSRNSICACGSGKKYKHCCG